jgi:hypothetical protein
MATSETHYKTLLGPAYSWMLGDLDAAFARGAAVDLGAAESLQRRIIQLESKIDPTRTSSLLETDGSTREEDRL